MIRITLRFTVLLTICASLVILSSIVSSPHLSGRVGALSALGSGNSQIYFDLDTGVTQRYPSESLPSSLDIPFERSISVVYNASTASQTVYFVRENGTTALERIDNEQITVLGIYDDLYPVEAYWHPDETFLYVIDTGNLSDTTIYSISTVDGQRTALLTIENFLAGFAQPSPNMRYLLVRALDNTFSGSSIAGRTLYLVDLETLDIRNLGQPNGAYWSPDSSKIAFGTVSEREFMLDISVYDVEHDETSDLGIQASHVDLDVFQSFQRSGILWSPDSQGIAIQNRYDNVLHYVTVDGAHTSVTARSLRPLAWSSDNRHVLALGIDMSGNNGVFMVDLQAQQIIFIESQDPGFISVQGGVTWSSDGTHVITGDWLGINLYDTDGQLVSMNIFRENYPHVQIIPQSVSWIEGR